MSIGRIKKVGYLQLLRSLVYVYLILYAFPIFASNSENLLPRGEVSLRVYHLFVDVSGALKKQNTGDQEIEYFPCQINQGCTWIKRPKTETKPHFWQLVSQGTGVELEDANSNEHWLYDIPSMANSTGQHFAIAFGQGEFFETVPRENNPKKGRVINQAYGEVDFGEKIVRNLVQKPTLSNGCLEGHLFEELCRDIRDIKGRDFCSLKLRIASVKELIGYCERLWRYYSQESYQIYQALLAEAGNKQLEDVSSLFRDQPIEEGSECQAGTVQAVKLFRKYYTFEGIGEYIERTKKEVQQLIQDDSISLPDFDESELQDPVEESMEENKDSGEQEEEIAAGKKRKRVDWEGRYNKKAAKERGYLLLDKKCVFQHQIEVCDLLVTQPKRSLVHVKRGTDSASLNHLFGQGYASADLLSRSESSEKIILELIRKEVNERMAYVMKEKQQQLISLWPSFERWRTGKAQLLTGKAYGILRKAERFPEAKIELAEFCKALKKFAKDKEAEEIAKQLDKYRVDLIETRLNDCWKALDSSITAETIAEVFKRLKTQYSERYDKENSAFLLQDLESILGSEDIRNFRDKLREGLASISSSQENIPDFNVVYGIITSKKKDENVLPLGARVNLLRTVRDLTDQTKRIKFGVSVKIIKEKATL